jgi:lysozyme
MIKINKEGCDLIKHFEGCELQAYADPASDYARAKAKTISNRPKGWEKLSAEPVTIGYGSTGLDHFNLDTTGKPTKISLGLIWTQEQADNRFQQDIEAFSCKVRDMITSKINENHFSALVSFAYNCGLANLKSSTLLKRVNEANWPAAAIEFLKWDKAQGKVMPGLTRRREAEKALFSKR